MLRLIALLSLVAGATAFIVCTPELCGTGTPEPLNCPGKVIKNGGFCGCTDACAKQEGDSCFVTSHISLLGVPSYPDCDDGLECATTFMNLGMGRCQKKQAKRDTTLTHCQQMRQIRMISFVVWQGMWTPKCDVLGNYLPQQCDNIGQCFCVTQTLGKVIESTKTKSPTVDCSSVDLTDIGHPN